MLAIEKVDRVAVVTLNRNETAQASPHTLREALHDAIVAVAADDSVSVVLLTGQEEGFPDGLDIAALGAEPLTSHNAPPTHNPATAIRHCAKPVIAAVTGAAIAGGFELVLACDLVIASTNARFADTHVQVGVDPGPEFVRRLVQMVGPQRATELSLTGAFLEAEMAYEWDLIGRITAPEDLASTALHIAHEMARAPLANLVKRKAANAAACA
ncbi:MAG: enoyl-CoA hydratase-related protein [Caulobacterales bacterium]